jgi:hypothetical protein
MRQELFFQREGILERIRSLCPEMNIGAVTFSL